MTDALRIVAVIFFSTVLVYAVYLALAHRWRDDERGKR